MSSWKRLAAISCCCSPPLSSATRRRFAAASAGASLIASGGVLPGVTIVATSDATGISRTTASSATGDFSMTDLPLGTYTVEATLQGFQTVEDDRRSERLASVSRWT